MAVQKNSLHVTPGIGTGSGAPYTGVTSPASTVRTSFSGMGGMYSDPLDPLKKKYSTSQTGAPNAVNEGQPVNRDTGSLADAFGRGLGDNNGNSPEFANPVGGVTNTGYPQPGNRLDWSKDPNNPAVAAAKNAVASANLMGAQYSGMGPRSVSGPNAYSGFNPGQSVRSLFRALGGGAGYGVSGDSALMPRKTNTPQIMAAPQGDVKALTQVLMGGL